MLNKKIDCISYSFFGRSGGYSRGLYSSLNCSKFVGDELENVNRNLNYAKQFIDADLLITLNQVHGADCLIVNKDSKSDSNFDAMVTNVTNIAIGILTADCAPVLFFDKNEKIIGAAHAGWKGAYAGILENTIEKMQYLGSKPSDIQAIIGPCIHCNSYEVHNDFIKNFSKYYSCFSSVKNRNYFDLPKFCTLVLRKIGIKSNNINLVDIDTYKQHDKYFSYRYAKNHTNGICGRNISLICLK